MSSQNSEKSKISRIYKDKDSEHKRTQTNKTEHCHRLGSVVAQGGANFLLARAQGFPAAFADSRTDNPDAFCWFSAGPQFFLPAV